MSDSTSQGENASKTVYLGEDPELAMLLKGLLDALDGGPPVSIDSANREVLDKVLEYLSHHRGEVMSTELEMFAFMRPSAWDAEFISHLDVDLLFNVVMVANYLGMNPLLSLGTRDIANRIKGRTPAQIRDLFGIPNNFTAEEDAAMANSLGFRF